MDTRQARDDATPRANARGALCVACLLVSVLMGCGFPMWFAGPTASPLMPSPSAVPGVYESLATSITGTPTARSASPAATPRVPMMQVTARFPAPTPTGMPSQSSSRMVVSPATVIVQPGESFSVTVMISSTEMMRGAQAGLRFDPALLEATGWEEGALLKNWAVADGGDTALGIPPVLDNEHGTISPVVVFIQGGRHNKQGATGAGSLVILHLRARPGAHGQSALRLAGSLINMEVYDTDGYALPGLVVTDGLVQAGSGGDAPLPTPASRVVQPPTPTVAPPPMPEYGSVGDPSYIPPPTVPAPSQAALAARDYIAQRNGIPLTAMLIIADQIAMYPNLGRKFQAVSLFDTSRLDGKWYYPLVDLNTGQIEEDRRAIAAADEQAYRAKYGKLEPSLYERLQVVKDDEILPVAIWAGGGPQRSDEEIWAEIATRFPEVRAAMDRHDKPMAVADPELQKRLWAEFSRMSEADTAARLEPLLARLKALGVEVRTCGAMPSVTTRLTKRQILELEQHNEMGMIYLIDAPAHPMSDTATGAAPSKNVGGRGMYTGAGLVLLALGLIYFSRRMNRSVKQKLPWLILGTAAALTLVLLYLSACQPRETDLPFETIERTEQFTGHEYEGREPKLVIVAEAGEIGALANITPVATQAHVRDLDYSQCLAIAVFQGLRGSNRYGADIQRVARKGNSIIIYAHFTEPKGLAADIMTSPYHLVRVQKMGLRGKTTFMLNVDGAIVSQQTRDMP